MTLKHWTEPNGVFLIHIPADWQYRNPVFDKFEEKSPYSFEAYENSIGCFQLSCYPLSEKGVSPNLTIQKANSKIEWLESKVRDPEFEVHLWHAQVDDQLCFAKCIYDIKYRKKSKAKKLLKRVRASLDSLRVKPENERNYFRALDKYDNFNASLAASYDMREKAFYSNSYIEIIAIISNQIDAFLRIAIVLKK